MVKFLILNGNCEGLLSPTELEQSSSETLNYITRLTWNCVLKVKLVWKICRKAIWHFT